MSAVETYVEQYAAARASLPGVDLPWLARLREAAIARFADAGLPTRRLEAWKFTDLRSLERTAYVPAPPRENGVGHDAIAELLPAGLACHLLVFVDGRLRAGLSDIGALPAGARLLGLAEALASDPETVEAALGAEEQGEGDAPAALNTALMRDGAVLVLDPGVALERPVHIVHLGTSETAPAANHLRNLVVAGAGSSVTLIETYAATNGAAYWTNAVADLRVGRDATVRHLKLQKESAEAVHVAATRVRLEPGSAYDGFALTRGARLSRNGIFARLDGGGIDCRLGGVFVARGRQHADTTTVIDHLKPGSHSREHYRGVLDDAAHGVFQGRIVVHPGAQQTDAHQLNKNLLLSEAAQIDTKPELEIHADDVKCSHGATVGELDAEALFYLRSRGLDAERARHLLIEAFLGEAVAAVEQTALRAHLWRDLANWLPQ
ncbi:MAG: Fe-S cluster assembly protein SufD [Alphaproteobacteria bacterium]